MNLYLIFFWLLMGLILGVALSVSYAIWFWKKAVARGVVAIKEENGNWIGKTNDNTPLFYAPIAIDENDIITVVVDSPSWIPAKIERNGKTIWQDSSVL